MKTTTIHVDAKARKILQRACAKIELAHPENFGVVLGALVTVLAELGLLLEAQGTLSTKDLEAGLHLTIKNQRMSRSNVRKRGIWGNFWARITRAPKTADRFAEKGLASVRKH